MRGKGLFSLLYLISPLVIIGILYHADSERYSEPLLLAGMILGACAYSWLVLEIVLIARIRVWERYFGQDFLYRVHAIAGIVCVILVIAHKILEEHEAGETDVGAIGGMALIIFAMISLFAVFFFSNLLTSVVRHIIRLRRFLERMKFGRYETQVIIHNAVLAGVVIMFIHVMKTSNAEESIAVKVVYTAYFAAGITFYIYHKLIRRIILSRRPFNVRSVTREAGNMWTLKLVPWTGEMFRYKPGQFGFIRIFGPGVSSEEHPFSFSSDPSQRKFLTITVKELGDFTSRIGEIREGFRAVVDGPYGRFSYLNYPWEKSVFLIVGGVGITPALGMIRYMHSQDRSRHVTLVWGLNNRHEIICHDELRKMQHDMPNFRMIPVMFKDEEWEGERGVIDQILLMRIIERHDHDLGHTGFYVCGPLPMMKAVIPALKAIGIKRRKIHYEKFSL